jgi:PAS domain S-box-containing protein
MKRRCRASTGLLLVTLATLSASAASPKRVLMVFREPSYVAGDVMIEQAARDKLQDPGGGGIEIYTEHLYASGTRDYLREKYRDRRPDIILTTAMVVSELTSGDLIPGVPVVFMWVNPDPFPARSMGTNITGIVAVVDFHGTLDLIFRLQPETRRIVVIGGVGISDRKRLAQVEHASQAFSNRATFEFWTNQPMSELQTSVSRLPAGSVVLYAWMFRDVSGRPFVPVQALELLLEKASVPVYVFVDSQLGSGAVGGAVVPYDELGARAGEVVQRILRGASAADIPIAALTNATPKFDWRSLRRWGISESRLPPGSIVEYRGWTFWKQYRWHIVGVLGFCGLQTALIIGLLVNRTKRRQGEETLARLLRQNELILNSAAEGILGLDLQGNHLFVNPAAARMLGYEPEALIGRHSHSLWHHSGADGSPYPEEECKIYASFAAGTAHRESAEVFWRKDGTSFPVEYASTPMYEKGRLLGAVVTFEDITERKRADAELLRQRAELAHLSRVTMLGELSGSMAHELNQPLTAILSNAQAAQRFLAEEQPDLSELRDILGDIVAQDKRAGEVIRRLRLLLKKGEVQQRPLSVNEVVLEVLRLVRSDLVNQNFTARTDLAPDLPLVHGDGVQLQQVLLNLVMNACDAMAGAGKDARQLTIRTDRSKDGCVRVSVVDCGPGIAPEKLEQVFESFYTTKAQGMGLGLAVCRSIITAHNGKLWATNNPGRGAAFHFTLPVAREGVQGSGFRVQGAGGRDQ